MIKFMKLSDVAGYVRKGIILITLLSVCGISKAQKTFTLQDALKVALNNSPDLKQAQLSLERSQWNMKAQKAALKSNFSLDVNPVDYSRVTRFDSRTSEWYYNNALKSSGTFSITQPILPTDGKFILRNRLSWQNSQNENTGKTDETYQNNLSLEFDQPLFTYNRSKMALEELKLDNENVLISYNLKLLNLEREVTRMFYNLYEAQMVLDVSRDEYKNNQKSYDIIKNKVEGGLAATEELYQAELNLASSKASVYNKEVSLEEAKDNFRIALDFPFDTDFTVSENIEVKTIAIDLPTAVNYGLSNRQELIQRKIDIDKAQFSLIQTKATNEFKGSVNASIGMNDLNANFSKLYAAPKPTPGVALSFNIPIYDLGYREAKINAAQTSIESSEIDFDQQKRTIEKDIRSVYRSLLNLKYQIDIEEQNVRNAQLTYEINLERYENGDLTGMDLSLYQNQLSTKKINLTKSKID